MKILLTAIMFFSLHADELFSTYESGLYKEVNPHNKSFMPTYMDNYIKKAFRKYEGREDTLLIDNSGNQNSLNIASPIIAPNSKVKKIYIKNEIRSDIYVHNKR